MFVFWGSFRFFWGNEILPFCCRSRIHGHIFTLALFQEWYEYFLVQIKCVHVAGKSFCLIFDVPVAIVHLSCYCRCKEKNNWNELCIQGQVTPFLKLQLLMFTGLKRLEMRVIENCVFFISRVRTECYKFWVSSGWVVAVR